MKAQSHREWYRNLGNNPFPVAFRHAPPWVFERMRRPRRVVTTKASLRVRFLKAFLAVHGHRG